jgi:hypothetical protein
MKTVPHDNAERKRRRQAALLAATVIGFWSASLVASESSFARAESHLSWTVRIDGHDVSNFSRNHPLVLSPHRPARIDVRITNLGQQSTLTVRSVRFQGRVLGLAFFSYDTAVNMSAGPGRSDERAFSVDLSDLAGQATGLIPSRVQLLGDGSTVVASDGFVVDVRGSLRSVYGEFGIAVAAITALLLGGALWALLTGRLHPNRWRRAMTFAMLGVGIGFVLTFTLSALRLLVPSPSAWTLILIIGGVVGFVAGYFAPAGPVEQTTEAPIHDDSRLEPDGSEPDQEDVDADTLDIFAERSPDVTSVPMEPS